MRDLNYDFKHLCRRNRDASYATQAHMALQAIGTSAAFLNPDELALLTGFHRKGRQVEQLRHMGIAFYINGCGRPVVPRTAIEGGVEGPSPRVWSPSVVKLARGA